MSAARAVGGDFARAVFSISALSAPTSPRRSHDGADLMPVKALRIEAPNVVTVGSLIGRKSRFGRRHG
jgi:hypothetical protein